MAIPISRGGIDYPDFHASLMLGDSASDVSLAELAVRLNSSINYSRAGNIVYIENFNKGCGNWLILGNDSSCTPKLVTNPVENGFYSVSLQYSPDVEWISYMSNYLSLPTSAAFGVTFSINTLSTIQELLISYILTTEEKQIKVDIKFSTNDYVIFLKDNSNNWINIGKYYISPDSVNIFYHWKVLIVPQLNNLRFISINQRVFTTSHIILPHGGGGNYSSLFLSYSLAGQSSDEEQVFIDNIYVSINE